MELLSICAFCGAKLFPVLCTRGTLVVAEQECLQCRSSKTWRNQNYVGSIPEVNLAISCGILFSGATPTKALAMLQCMEIESIAYSTFMEHQRFYLHPVVQKVWLDEQTRLVRDLRNRGGATAFGGDGRADSPGHCAKFGSHSLMDLRAGKIVAVELVQVSG